MSQPIALGMIRTDLVGGGTRLQQQHMLQRIERDGYMPLIEYLTEPIPPDELSEIVQRLRVAVVVVQNFEVIGVGGFKAVRDLADVWTMQPEQVYRRTTSDSAQVRQQVRETLEQAGNRIKGELAAEVSELDAALGQHRAVG